MTVQICGDIVLITVKHGGVNAPSFFECTIDFGIIWKNTGKDLMKKWFKENIITITLVSIMVLGLGLISYPTVSDWWNSFHMTRAVETYASSVAQMDTSEYDKLIAEAEAYNETLVRNGLQWNMTEEEAARYESILNITGDGIMGYIDIPKIKVTLPVYHGTSESVLQVAIGHIAGTSFPVGGSSTHCSVSGHRGLPSARLFTDIVKLAAGDTWTMTVLNRTITYEVDQIRIVEPIDLEELQIEEGQDYCTLITCTPYGINTHRLLVRGHRIANADGDAYVTADAFQVDPNYVALGIAACILLLLLAWLVFATSSWGRKKLQHRKEKREGLADERLEKAAESLQILIRQDREEKK